MEENDRFIVTMDDVVLYGLWSWANIDPGDAKPEVRYIGAKARYAVMDALGLPRTLESLASNERGWSVTYMGRTLDVKVSTGMLLFPKAEDFVADITVLVCPSGTEPDPYVRTTKAHRLRDVEIVGWVHREDFMERHEVRDFPIGKRAVMEGSALHDPAKLWLLDEEVTVTTPSA